MVSLFDPDSKGIQIKKFFICSDLWTACGGCRKQHQAGSETTPSALVRC